MAWFEHGTSRIYYEEAGEGEAVLLLPGMTDRIEHHMPLRDALVAAGCRVIAADLPGSGRSLPQPRRYSTTYYQEDADTFAALLRQLGAVPAHLVGFSDGGEVEFLMAEMSPDVARSLVTWGAAGKLSDPDGQLRAMLYQIVDNPVPPMQEFSKHLIATYGKDIARAITQNAVLAHTAIIETRGGDISLSQAGSIACPVLLITGEHDLLAPPSLVAELASRIPNARLETVKDAGHDIHHSHTEWLSRTILGFLKQPSNITA